MSETQSQASSPKHVLPGPDSRWRCGHCGNLTRFDVTRTRTTDEYWHISLSGNAEVEQVEVLAETIDNVSCRWCGASDAIEVIAKPDDPERAVFTQGLGGTP